jgi:alpha-glucosidase (family GH31 glycosyl hydrolase)
VDRVSYPPYAVNNFGRRAPLSERTIGVTARHQNGWAQYNTHNLYSLSEAQVTYQALSTVTAQRPFLLSR